METSTLKLKKETRHLSNYDLNVLLPILIKSLEMKQGKENAVRGKQIIEGLRNHGLKINRRSLYMLINHIRTNDLVVGLMASTVGYYITSNNQELMDYENSLLSREVEIRKVRKSIKRQRSALFLDLPKKQTQLF